MVSKAAYELMDELYFVISFSDLAVQSELSRLELTSLLEQLAEAQWIDQLRFNSEIGDYEKLRNFDKSSCENDAYLASKRGLLNHNGFKTGQ